jgi:hypothetical protein
VERKDHDAGSGGGENGFGKKLGEMKMGFDVKWGFDVGFFFWEKTSLNYSLIFTFNF